MFGHLKTGQCEKSLTDVDGGEKASSLRWHEQHIQRRNQTANHSTGTTGTTVGADSGRPPVCGENQKALTKTAGIYAQSPRGLGVTRSELRL